jgi:hypothetical protein
MGHPVRPKKGLDKKFLNKERQNIKKVKNNFKTLEASKTSKKLTFKFNLFQLNLTLRCFVDRPGSDFSL